MTNNITVLLYAAAGPLDDNTYRLLLRDMQTGHTGSLVVSIDDHRDLVERAAPDELVGTLLAIDPALISWTEPLAERRPGPGAHL